MYCSNCGARVADQVPFCSNCGSPVNASPRNGGMNRSNAGAGFNIASGMADNNEMLYKVIEAIYLLFIACNPLFKIIYIGSAGFNLDFSVWNMYKIAKLGSAFTPVTSGAKVALLITFIISICISICAVIHLYSMVSGNSFGIHFGKIASVGAMAIGILAWVAMYILKSAALKEMQTAAAYAYESVVSTGINIFGWLLIILPIIYLAAPSFLKKR